MIDNKPLPLYEGGSLVVQGEGKFAGIPHILIRTLGCNLRCFWCDAFYTSWKPEHAENPITWETINKIYEDNPQIKHTMITGGGPTLQPELLKNLCQNTKQYGHFITIETEGSEFVQTVADFISLSPKFRNSTPIAGEVHPYIGRVITEKEVRDHEKGRCNYQAMYDMVTKHKDFQIKPVINNEDQLDELEELYDKLWIIKNNYLLSNLKEKERYFNYLRAKTYCMPEGLTDEQLNRNRQWLIKECIKRGYNYTDRLHIVAFGNMRGV